MIVFTKAGCPYCYTAKRDYLVPMQNSAEWRDKVIIREVDVDSSATMRDFEGRSVSHGEFSKRYQVTRVPTVIVMNDQGKPAASPLVGLSSDDFYALYLQQAVEAGLIPLRNTRRGN
jgi:thioredoxin-related protein